MRTNNPRKVRITDAYYSWLCDLVGVNQEEHSYWMLMNILATTPFLWFVPNDDNRASDGMELRERFIDEHNIFTDLDELDGNCTILELLIGLAYRCEFTMADQEYSIPMRDWFWKMLRNARLDRFTDDSFYTEGGPEAIEKILDKINERTYHRNGQGGFFPLKKYKKDQRKVELWYQMSTYLVENYYFEDDEM